jgi:hypothetical protein
MQRKRTERQERRVEWEQKENCMKGIIHWCVRQSGNLALGYEKTQETPFF